MIEEKLGQEAEVLAVDWVFGAIDLEYCNFILLVSVDLVTWRVEERTIFAMALQLLLEDEKA